MPKEYTADFGVAGNPANTSGAEGVLECKLDERDVEGTYESKLLRTR